MLSEGGERNDQLWHRRVLVSLRVKTFRRCPRVGYRGELDRWMHECHQEHPRSHGIRRQLESIRVVHVVRSGGEDVRIHRQHGTIQYARGAQFNHSLARVRQRQILVSGGFRIEEASNPGPPQLLRRYRGGVGRHVVPRIAEPVSLRRTQVDGDDEPLAAVAVAETSVNSPELTAFGSVGANIVEVSDTVLGRCADVACDKSSCRVGRAQTAQSRRGSPPDSASQPFPGRGDQECPSTPVAAQSPPCHRQALSCHGSWLERLLLCIGAGFLTLTETLHETAIDRGLGFFGQLLPRSWMPTVEPVPNMRGGQTVRRCGAQRKMACAPGSHMIPQSLPCPFIFTVLHSAHPCERPPA